jgi:hypothetical protein
MDARIDRPSRRGAAIPRTLAVVRVLASGCAAALALASAGTAEANPPAAAEAARAVPLPLDVLPRLRSGDPVRIKSALDDVRTSGRAGAAAAPAIAELLERGLSPSLTQAAIDTLADTGSPAASSALGWYAHHRNLDVRRAAVQALVRTGGPGATKALREALSDPDPEVRASAATGLGTLNAKEAVTDLFAALDHKVGEAATSIGQLCAGAECERLAGKLGQVAFDVVTSGLHQVLFRPAADVNDDLKVKIVGRVRELGTGEANRFLRDVQTKWPKAWSPRVRVSIDQAVIATSGSPGASGGGPK